MAVAYVHHIGPSGDTYRRMQRDGFTGSMPKECLAHAAGTDSDGSFHITEIWESAEAHDRFEQDVLVPAFQRYGVDTSGGTHITYQVENLVLSDARPAQV